MSIATSTQESYQTVQSEQNPFETSTQSGEPIKIDKPEGHLFTNLKPNTENKPEASINVTMVQPSASLDVPMGPQPMKPTELKHSPPKSFSGEREDLDGFCYLYINEDIYDTDIKIIDMHSLSWTKGMPNPGKINSLKVQTLLELSIWELGMPSKTN